MSNQILSLAGWYILPELVTGYVQSTLYAVFIRAGDPKPAPGSRPWIQHRKYIKIFVIVAYLLYTVYESDYQLQRNGDFYRDLGVAHDASEKAIQSRFRRLTVQYHPDKATGEDKAMIEAIYVQLKVARDTLADPAKRFAYDRFGPEVLQWRQSKTLRDFVFRGIQLTSIYYAATGGVLILLGTLGLIPSGTFWRYLTMAVLFMVELHFITRPTFPGILTHFVNPVVSTTRLRSPYLPFQLITLIRKLAITFFIALGQLGPLLQDPQAHPEGDKVTPQQLERLDALAKAMDTETARLMGLELTPFASSRSSMDELRQSLKQWLVHNTLRNDQEVNKAMTQVLNRRRAQDGLNSQ